MGFQKRGNKSQIIIKHNFKVYGSWKLLTVKILKKKKKAPTEQQKMHYNNKKYNLQCKLSGRVKEEISLKYFLLCEMIVQEELVLKEMFIFSCLQYSHVAEVISFCKCTIKNLRLMAEYLSGQIFKCALGVLIYV